MKRYFVVNEFFGVRIYDSKYKKEYYYNNQVADLIKKC